MILYSGGAYMLGYFHLGPFLFLEYWELGEWGECVEGEEWGEWGVSVSLWDCWGDERVGMCDIFPFDVSIIDDY